MKLNGIITKKYVTWEIIFQLPFCSGLLHFEKKIYITLGSIYQNKVSGDLTLFLLNSKQNADGHSSSVAQRRT